MTEVWSRLAIGEPTAVAFAGDEVVIGDTSGLVVRIGPDGGVVSERPLPAPIHALSATRDGRHVAVACGEGEILLLNGDRIAFRSAPGPYFTMTRMGPDGEYLLALAPNGDGHFLNRYGREMGRLDVPDGADSAVLLPETGRIVTGNCDGLIQCFTPWGKPLWRADLSMDAGRISGDDTGSLLLVPVHVYGATAMTSEGASVGAYDVGEPVGSVGCDGSGSVILLATLKNRLVVLDREANVLASEVFLSEVRDVAVAPEGDRMLVTTSSGYTHLLELADQASGPLLEFGAARTGTAGGGQLFRQRVFTPYCILMPPRVDFADDGSFVVVAGGGGRTVAFDLEGHQIDERRFRGSLLDLVVADSGAVRVVTTKTIMAFRPGESRGATSFEPPADLYQVSRALEGPSIAVSEDGDLFRIDDSGVSIEHLFTLPGGEPAGISVTADSIAVALKSGDLLIHGHSGEVIGQSGPWPSRARILTSGNGGYLVAVGKAVFLLGSDGEEKWRYHLATPPRYGVAVPGAFLVVDDFGAAFSATCSGIVRRTFSVGQGRLVPYPDGGDGPGFLKAEGGMLTAVHPDGRPRWRSRLSESVTYMRPSRDGRFAGVVSGLDLYVYALTSGARAAPDVAESSRYLEFADG